MAFLSQGNVPPLTGRVGVAGPGILMTVLGKTGVVVVGTFAVVVGTVTEVVVGTFTEVVGLTVEVGTFVVLVQVVLLAAASIASTAGSGMGVAIAAWKKARVRPTSGMSLRIEGILIMICVIVLEREKSGAECES